MKFLWHFFEVPNELNSALVELVPKALRTILTKDEQVHGRICVILHGTGTEIRYQDPSALPWSKMATATAGKDVYTAISTLSHCVSRVWRRV